MKTVESVKQLSNTKSVETHCNASLFIPIYLLKGATMHFIFKFPDIGEGISEGKILEWYVKKGQSVKSGEPLVKMETDKVVADIPSPKNGVIVSCFGKTGDIVRVEDPLVELEIEGVSPEQAQKIRKDNGAEPVENKCLGVVGTLEVANDGAYLPSSEEGNPKKIEYNEKKVLATPVARAIAKELMVNINEIEGTGPLGRVKKRDIENYVKEQSIDRKSVV